MMRAGDNAGRSDEEERRFEPDNDAAGLAGIVGVPPACWEEWCQ